MAGATVVAFLKKWRTAVAVVLVIAGTGAFFGVGSFAAFRANLRSAEQGDMLSQMHLAKRFKSRENYERAAHWYREAAAQGNLIAMYQLANLHRSSRLENSDFTRAYALMKEAAEGHYIEAQLGLSNLYRIGDIIERDFPSAYLWADIAKYNKLMPADRTTHLISVSIAVNWAREHLAAEQTRAANLASLAWRQQYPDAYDQELTEDPPASDRQAGN